MTMTTMTTMLLLWSVCAACTTAPDALQVDDIQVHAAAAHPALAAAGTTVYSVGHAVPAPGAVFIPGGLGTNIQLTLSSNQPASSLPLTLPVGATLTSWSVRLDHKSGGDVTAQLWRATTQGNAAAVGPQFRLGGWSGDQIVGAVAPDGPNEVIAPTSYFISIHSEGVSGDTVEDYQTTVL